MLTWVFPKIVVPPKSSILTGFFHYFHHPFLGYHRFWKHPHVVFVPPVNYFTTRSFGFSPWAPFQTNVNSFGNIRGFRFKKQTLTLSRGLYLMPKAKLLQSSGSMIFKNCTCGKEGQGGGFLASGRNVVQVSGGQMFFEDCVAKDGGGIKIKNHGKFVTWNFKKGPGAGFKRYFMFTPILVELMQFDLRIFFQMG